MKKIFISIFATLSLLSFSAINVMATDNGGEKYEIQNYETEITTETGVLGLPSPITDTQVSTNRIEETFTESDTTTSETTTITTETTTATSTNLGTITSETSSASSTTTSTSNPTAFRTTTTIGITNSCQTGGVNFIPSPNVYLVPQPPLPLYVSIRTTTTTTQTFKPVPTTNTTTLTDAPRTGEDELIGMLGLVSAAAALSFMAFLNRKD